MSIESFRSLPNVSFIDNISLPDVERFMREAYQEEHARLTGEKLILQDADPAAISLRAASVYGYQTALFVDMTGKQNLLRYATGDTLDNLAANWGVARLPASAAHAIVRFTLSAPQASAIPIPAGTRITNGTLYFVVEDYTEVPPGATYIDSSCVCTEAGVQGSGIVPGALNILVDRLPYVASVANLETTSGGADAESDEALRERTYLAPSGWSTAGPRDAYIYHAKSYAASIGSVNATSPVPGHVEVRVLLKDGSLPGEAMLQGILEHLRDDTIRPLTDFVTVLAPEIVNYDVDLTYYIGRSAQDQATTIQMNVTQAVAQWNVWQTSEIGRDINPCVLMQEIITAGAKRVDIHEPTFRPLPGTTVARLGTVRLTYGGVEDD